MLMRAIGAQLHDASRAHEKNKRPLYELARLSEKTGDYPAAAAYLGGTGGN